MKCFTAELGQISAQITLSLALTNILPGTMKQESSYRYARKASYNTGEILEQQFKESKKTSAPPDRIAKRE
jgi:hypothetical protein